MSLSLESWKVVASKLSKFVKGTPYSRQAARTSEGATRGSVGNRRLMLEVEVFNNAEVEDIRSPERFTKKHSQKLAWFGSYSNFCVLLSPGLEALENAPESQSSGSFSELHDEITELVEDVSFASLEAPDGRPLSSLLLHV